MVTNKNEKWIIKYNAGRSPGRYREERMFDLSPWVEERRKKQSRQRDRAMDFPRQRDRALDVMFWGQEDFQYSWGS